MLFAQYRLLPLRLANLAPALGIGGFIGLVIVSHFPAALIDASPFLKFLTPGVMLIVFSLKADRAVSTSARTSAGSCWKAR